jgi:hypothetical protein
MDEDRQEQPGADGGKSHEDDADAFSAYQDALKEQDQWLERMQKAKAKKGEGKEPQ